MPPIKTHEWSPTERGKVLGLVKGKHHSLREITNITNIPKTTIYDIKTRNTGETKPRSGRPKLLDEMTLRQIIRYIKTDKQMRHQSLAVIIDVINLEVSPRTLRRVLHSHGLHFCIAR